MIISEQTFLQELLDAIPEFQQIHESFKEYHDIGVNLIMGSLKRLAESAVEEKDEELLQRIQKFIIRCHTESKDEVDNAIFVTFFENMNQETLEYFLKNLPKDFSIEVQKYLQALDEATTMNKQNDSINSKDI